MSGTLPSSAARALRTVSNTKDNSVCGSKSFNSSTSVRLRICARMTGPSSFEYSRPSPIGSSTSRMSANSIAASTPVQKLGVDAAILFADILLVLEPMGLGLEYSKDDGPVIRAQIRSRTDVEELNDFEPQTELSFVFETVRKAR